jgi:hypothetical protein
MTAFCVCLWGSSALAQGNIFGIVQNADASSPSAGELLWVGFLDNRDQEIRIESNTGAGYDGVNWFDDFQNYTTEAAGNPYDFLYVNTVNGQGFHLQDFIPSNSFQREDVTLVAMTVPVRPTDLLATVTAPTTIALSWSDAPGLTYHVYRRVTSNNSVYMRLDDPAGDLSNPGVSGSAFVDTTSDGVSLYSYIIMAEDAVGNYSAHSATAEVDAAVSSCACDCFADPACDGTTNVLDVVQAANVAFRGGAPIFDPNAQCPFDPVDVDCSGTVNVIDVVRLVNVAFRAGDPALQFCDPCAP